MIDQLSMNFGKENYKNYKMNPNPTIGDTNSVASVITKGGTVVANPFAHASGHHSRNASNNKSNTLNQSSRFKNSPSKLNKRQQGLIGMASGELSIELDRSG